MWQSPHTEKDWTSMNMFLCGDALTWETTWMFHTRDCLLTQATTRASWRICRHGKESISFYAKLYSYGKQLANVLCTNILIKIICDYCLRCHYVHSCSCVCFVRRRAHIISGILSYVRRFSQTKLINHSLCIKALTYNFTSFPWST